MTVPPPDPTRYGLAARDDGVDRVLVQSGLELDGLAREIGTPLYSYAADQITDDFQSWRAAFAEQGFEDTRHRTCFAVKANDAQAVLGHLCGLGSGFDIVSEGELRRVLAAGGDPASIVFSGPAKTEDELRAALDAGVGLINVEAPDEARALAEIAARRDAGPVSVGVRFNPDLDPGTHPAVATGPEMTKFGLSPRELAEVTEAPELRPWLEVTSVAVHIGSQVRDVRPLVEAARQALRCARRLRGLGHPIDWLDLGGGLAVAYDDLDVPSPADLAAALAEPLAEWDGGLITEPGRSLVARCGVLLTTVVRIRERRRGRLIVCDAGMNVLLRPALYDAVHPVLAARDSGAERMAAHVVGPLCETGDVLARDVLVSADLAAGDVLAIACARAYGHVMSSGYNSLPRAALVWVADGRARVVRARGRIEDEIALELRARDSDLVS